MWGSDREDPLANRRMQAEMRRLHSKLEAWGGADGVAAKLREQQTGTAEQGGLAGLVQRAKERVESGDPQLPSASQQDDGDVAMQPVVGLAGFQQVVGSDGSASIVVAALPREEAAQVVHPSNTSTKKKGGRASEKVEQSQAQTRKSNWMSWTGDHRVALAEQIGQREEVFGNDMLQAVKNAARTKPGSDSAGTLVDIAGTYIGIAKALEQRSAELEQMGRSRWAKSAARAAVLAYQAAIQADANTHVKSRLSSGNDEVIVINRQ